MLDQIAYATITNAGDIRCPQCGTEIITPGGHNPYRSFEWEKFCVVSETPAYCPACEAVFMLSEDEARKHNRFWFPDDQRFSVTKG